MPEVRGELSEVHGEQVWFSVMDFLFYHLSQPAENVWLFGFDICLVWIQEFLGKGVCQLMCMS